MTTFAKEFCENRLHCFCPMIKKKFSMIDQIIAYNKTFVAQKGYDE